MHLFATFYHSLVQAGLWHTLLTTFINVVVVGGVFLPARKALSRVWQEHLDGQAKIADRLDPVTPGGLHEVVIARQELAHVQKELETIREAVSGSGQGCACGGACKPQKGA